MTEGGVARIHEKAEFPEVLSRFLAGKLDVLRQKNGEESQEYKALARQYLRDPREDEVDWKAERRRHYEAELVKGIDGEPLTGIERLYRRVALIDLTTSCLAHCRYCLRQQYSNFTLTKDDVRRAAEYFGSPGNRDDLREVLITGGDPLLLPELLEFAIDAIVRLAPNIEIVRIGSRLPLQQPDLVNEAVLRTVRRRKGLRVELGTQVNHPLELWDESRSAYVRLQEQGVSIYNQQVLLRGVNDSLDVLCDLYDNLRYLGIEAHYMFHCIPLRGAGHHRTTVQEGLDLVKGLTSSGSISGRGKPMYTAMTDIGKVTLYEGSIIDCKGDMVMLQTGYTLQDRLRWNPNWKLPESATPDDQGRLTVWYKDAQVHNEGWASTYLLDESPAADGKVLARCAPQREAEAGSLLEI
jgi:lysine 2,3-aminomutase